MAYSDIYKLTYYDRCHNLVEVTILKEDYEGSCNNIIMGKEPVTIQYNLEKRVYGTGAIFNIVNTFNDEYLFAKMLLDTYETYKGKIEIAGNIYFEGYLLPQTFNQDVRNKSYVALTFGNGLRMLENITPSFLTDDIDDYVLETDILINIFSYLNLDYTIYINSTLYEDSMSAAEKADNPLKATYNNRLAFQKNNGDWDDALTILNKILTSMNAYCYIRGERIMVERFVDKANNPKTFWTYNPNTTTHSDITEAFNEKTLDYIILSANSFKYQVDQPIKKLKVKLNTLQFNNIFSNDFDRNEEYVADLYILFKWVYSSLIRIMDTNFSNSFMTRGIEFTKSGPNWDNFGDAFFTYTGIITNKNNDVVLDLEFKSWRWMPTGTTLVFYYRIALQSATGGSWYFVDADDNVGAYTTLQTTIKNDGDSTLYGHTINRTVDLAGKLDTLGLTDEVYVALVVMPPEYEGAAGGGVYGDFSLNQSDIRINNLLEADLNNDAFKTIEETLDLYDAGYVHYRTAKLIHSDIGGYQASENWTDDFNTSKSLQRHYILNRGNLFNSSCAILHLTMMDKYVDVNIDDIFVFNNLEDDLGNPMKFYIIDYTFNVRKHTYTLKLKQWLADVGKGIS